MAEGEELGRLRLTHLAGVQGKVLEGVDSNQNVTNVSLQQGQCCKGCWSMGYTVGCLGAIVMFDFKVGVQDGSRQR